MADTSAITIKPNQSSKITHKQSSTIKNLEQINIAIYSIDILHLQQQLSRLTAFVFGTIGSYYIYVRYPFWAIYSVSN